MPNRIDQRAAIAAALNDFGQQPLPAAARRLFAELGYKSNRSNPISTPKQFCEQLDPSGKLTDRERESLESLQSLTLLFQLTDAEFTTQQDLFDDGTSVETTQIHSYLFFAAELPLDHYTRTALSTLVRAVNKPLPMPALVLFRHGDSVSIGIIHRRLHKRDQSKDVLEKVTLIKDICVAAPHRGHIEILFDLSFAALHDKHGVTDWVALHNAWQKTLDSSELNKRFFQEIANWYFWALQHVRFPKDAPKTDGKDHVSVIRLITRLIFCWFVKEKGLIPDALFDARTLSHTLDGFAPEGDPDTKSVFYRAILQNLFFATLNTEMDKRAWAKDEQNFMAHSVYRFRECFRDPETALALFQNIPFLNGGLFECLDKDLGEKARPRYVRIDGFSRRADSQPVVPDFLFFGPECEVDLSEAYGATRYRRAKVRGLIHTFERYKFTVTENTPIEEEVALDPELSGKVFENLLAANRPARSTPRARSSTTWWTSR